MHPSSSKNGKSAESEAARSHARRLLAQLWYRSAITRLDGKRRPRAVTSRSR